MTADRPATRRRKMRPGTDPADRPATEPQSPAALDVELRSPHNNGPKAQALLDAHGNGTWGQVRLGQVLEALEEAEAEGRYLATIRMRAPEEYQPAPHALSQSAGEQNR